MPDTVAHQQKLLRGIVVQWMSRDRAKVTRNLIVFEIAFFFAYRYGMTFSSDYPAPLWFPDSVLLCALLVSPRNTWWMYILAALPIRFLVSVPDAPVWFLFAAFVNDSLKGLLAAFLLRRGAGQNMWFDDLRGFVKYGLVAVGLAPALSALGGAAARVALGAHFWTAWKQWFLGDALANLMLTPALFCLLRDFRSIGRAKWTRHVEALLITAGLIFGAFVLFDPEFEGLNDPALVLYLPVPFLLWAAVRFGPLGASSVLSFISVLAMYGAFTGRRPSSSAAGESIVLSIQIFLLVPSIPFLLLSVLTQQQRKTHTALRESEHRFRSLVDTAPVMVWIADTDGLCTFFNKQWLDFTGEPEEQQLGNGWSACVHSEDRERCIQDYLTALHARKHFTMECRLRRYDGVYRWMLDTGIPRYTPDGAFLGYLGSCIDITHRHEAEEKLRRIPRLLINAQEAERNRIGQELHDDLGQRVVALSIGISHLAQQMDGNDKLAADCANLQQQASAVITDIARLSRQLRPVTLQRLGLPAALQSLCAKSANPDGVVVTFSQYGELKRVVPWIVSIALYRVAQEALRNALAHSGTDRINIDLHIDRTGLAVMITDRGCGFAVEHTTTTGLGLSGMAERMENIGGILKIDSSPGAGVTVTASVSIPEWEPSWT